MPSRKQKMLAIVINRMQNGAKIQMGPLSELNYDTASRVGEGHTTEHKIKFPSNESHKIMYSS